MNNEFSIDTVEQMWRAVQGTEDRLDILFLMSLDTAKRIKKVERHKRFDRACSTVAGTIGGLLGALFLKPKL